MATDAALAGVPSAAPDVVSLARQAETASDFLKALAHKGRLMILCHLVEGERSVGELEALIGARQAAVSQQLARLRLEGLVTSRRDGKTILYSLGDPRVATLIRTLHSVFCS
jgi:ArsR family transcriptional regulator